MGLYHPNCYITIGDTNYWNLRYRSTDVAVANDLRRLRRDFVNSSTRLTSSVVARAPGDVPQYTDMLIIVGNAGVNSMTFGIIEEEAVPAHVGLHYVGNQATSIGLTNSGDIRRNAAILQATGVTFSAGEAMGFTIYLDSSGLKQIQFYKATTSSITAVGTPVNITTGTRYVPAMSDGFIGTEVILRSDFDDIPLLPAGACAWGAAARVSDSGGFSPAAGQFSSQVIGNAADFLVDVYGMTATANAVNNALWATRGGTRTLTQQQRAGKIHYIEWELETAGSSRLGVGEPNITANPFSDDPLGWSYGPNGGATRNNSVNIATGITATAGDIVSAFITETEIWWAVNDVVIGGGDPLLGTSPQYSNLSGTLCPFASMLNNGVGVARFRLNTHARSQRFRRHYCTAWDGADVLPDQHYRGTLASDTEITTGLWLPIPWGGSRNTGSPIGAVEVANEDGRYDLLKTVDLRDQDLAIYEVEEADAPIAHLARANCDTNDFRDESRLRILTRGKDSRLDVGIPHDLFMMGQVNYMPMVPISAVDLTFKIGNIPAIQIGNFLSQGLPVTTFRRLPNAVNPFSIKRTVAPAGRQVINQATGYRKISTTPKAMTNADFSAWVANVPTGWAVTDNPPLDDITQSGTTCRFLLTGGTPVSISQNVTGGPTGFLIVELDVTVLNSGSLQVQHAANPAVNVRMNQSGTYSVPIFSTSVSSPLLISAAENPTDIRLDEVRVYDAAPHNAVQPSLRTHGLGYLLEDIGGFSPADWQIAENQTSGVALAGVSIWDDSKPLIRTVLDEWCRMNAADYYTREDGLLTIRRFPLDIIEVWTSDVTITDNDAASPIRMLDDRAPALSNTVRTEPNPSVHADQDIAGGVSDNDRSKLTSPWLSTVKTVFPSHPFYKHAWDAKPIDLRMSTSTVSQFRDNFIGYWRRRRYFYEREVTNKSIRGLRPFDQFIAQGARYGMTDGIPVVLISKRRRIFSPVSTIKFWG